MFRRAFLKLLAAVPLLAMANTSWSVLLAVQKTPIPETVEELYRVMNRVLQVGQSTCIAWAVTGEPYIEYALGIRLAGRSEVFCERHLCRWMWNTFRKQVLKLPSPANAVIYWRIKPEIEIFDASESFDLEIQKHDPLLERPALCHMRWIMSMSCSV